MYRGLILAAIVLMAIVGCGETATVVPTPETDVSPASPPATFTPEPTHTPGVSFNPTPTPTPVPTWTPEPTWTPIPTPTPTEAPNLPTATPTSLEIADGLVRLWVDDNKDIIAAEVLGALAVEVPLAGQLADTVLRAQVDENLDLVFAVPSRVSEGVYRLPVTAETEFELDLPLAGERTYEVSLPFTVDVDIRTREVADWSFDASSATVEQK